MWVGQALTAHPGGQRRAFVEGKRGPWNHHGDHEKKNLVGKVVGVTNDITPQVLSGIKDELTASVQAVNPLQNGQPRQG
jgi:hypothetical protein